MAFKNINDLIAGGIQGKFILLRLDLNLPLDGKGNVSDYTRLNRVLPTIRLLQKSNSKIIILTHLGRPKGKMVADLSLKPIRAALSEKLSCDVRLASDIRSAKDEKKKMQKGGILLLENLRFHVGEEKNDGDFARELAALGDYYVNDAFSVSHRAHASVEKITHYINSFAGLAMEQELTFLEKTLSSPARPVAAVIGGAKISTKIAIIENILDKIDHLIIGGAMANTFLLYQGINVQKSLVEEDCLPIAGQVLQQAKEKNVTVYLPSDVVCAPKLEANIICENTPIQNIPKDHMILDLGEASVQAIKNILSECSVVLWNGPLGAFEVEPFDAATNAVLLHVAHLTTDKNILSIAGGGDTAHALHHCGVDEKFSYLSTAGGAFLEYIEGKMLPGVKALDNQS